MGSEKISLILGSHAHVPQGAAEHEFENVYEQVLRPFVSTLCKYPKIQAALHYSGTLLYWVERSHPELFMLIEDLVSRRQAEVLGGGFYEPMLPIIPPQDRIGQIELMTTYLRRQFGKRPLGCWIPAFAWEQHLVSPLAACGMAYTFLGERQFLMAGAAPEDLFTPCISEDQGKVITVFPVFQSIEAALAEKNISLILEELGAPPPAGGRLSPGGQRIVSIFPSRFGNANGDGGNAGAEAPDYAWNRFFEELSLSEPLVECALPGKLLRGLKGLKKTAFPDSSGPSDPADADEHITPRRFLITHPEANNVYAKMIFTSVLINQLRGDKSRKLSAREELWKAQNCDLFCGAGKRRGHSLRKAAYRSLIGAERITREKGKFSPSLVQFDFDFDGLNEYLFQDTKINCYIRSAGAGIFELDYLPKTWNYLDGPARSGAFADSLLPGGAKAEELSKGFPAGSRFCFNERYEALSHDRSKGKACFILPPAGELPLGNIEIEKCFSLKKDILTVSYSIKNRSAGPETFCFVPEINLSFAGAGGEFVRFFAHKSGDKEIPFAETPALDSSLDSVLDSVLLSGIEGLKIQDLKNEVQINFSSAKPFGICLTGTRDGEQYQSHCIMPCFTISLVGGESWLNEFGLKFSH